MPALQGAVETAPVSRLHEKQSYDPADFPVPTVVKRSGDSLLFGGCGACMAKGRCLRPRSTS